MPARISINGQIVSPQQAVVSVYDHGLLYGDGVFEGIRVYGGKAFLLQEHLERLYESARAIRLEIPIDQQQMAEQVDDTVAAAIEALLSDERFEVNYIRLVVTRGAGDLGLDVRKANNPQIIIIA